jgi:hypothetical protein
VRDGLFSPGTPVSFTNKTDNYDITEILWKVAFCLALKQFYIKNVGLTKIPGCWTYVQQNENKFQKV